MDYTLNFGAVWRNFEYLMSGLALSLGLAAVSIVIGAAIGLALAFALTSRRLALSAPARLYVTLLRNLPILVLVLFAYFALPQLGSDRQDQELHAGAVALFRRLPGRGVPRRATVDPARPDRGRTGDRPDAHADPRDHHRATDAAQRAALAVVHDHLAVQDTSLAAVIAVPELTFAARKINVESFRVIETWIVTSALYVACCFLIAAALRLIERRLALPR